MIIMSNMESDEMDAETLNAEYDDYILELHRKLQLTRDGRKRSETEAKVLEHRVLLLQNQEKLAKQKFESTKTKLSDLIQKRKIIQHNHVLVKNYKVNKSQEKILLKEKAKAQRENIKKSKTFSKPSHAKSSSCGSINTNEWRESQKLEDVRREEERKLIILEKKAKLKEELLKKIYEDENERIFLERQLARVEKDEINIIHNLHEHDDPYRVYLEKASQPIN